MVLATATALLTACDGMTRKAAGVGATTATLKGERRCAAAVDARWLWQWRQLGTGGWSTGGAVRVACRGATASTPFSLALQNLRPDTSYQYRIAVDAGLPCDLGKPGTCSDVHTLDRAGKVNGTSYDTFTTQPQCDDVQGPAESMAAFVASNPPGNAFDRRVLCARQGTQDIGQLNGIKAWTTLTPRGEPDGTKQPLVLNGNVALQSQGASIEDARIVGCYRQAGCGTARDKTIDVRASDVVLSHLDVTQRGGRNADALQCVLVDAPSQLTGVR